MIVMYVFVGRIKFVKSNVTFSHEIFMDQQVLLFRCRCSKFDAILGLVLLLTKNNLLLSLELNH